MLCKAPLCYLCILYNTVSKQCSGIAMSLYLNSVIQNITKVIDCVSVTYLYFVPSVYTLVIRFIFDQNKNFIYKS